MNSLSKSRSVTQTAYVPLGLTPDPRTGWFSRDIVEVTCRVFTQSRTVCNRWPDGHKCALNAPTSQLARPPDLRLPARWDGTAPLTLTDREAWEIRFEMSTRLRFNRIGPRNADSCTYVEGAGSWKEPSFEGTPGRSSCRIVWAFSSEQPQVRRLVLPSGLRPRTTR